MTSPSGLERRRVWWDGFGFPGYGGIATYAEKLSAACRRAGLEPAVVALASSSLSGNVPVHHVLAPTPLDRCKPYWLLRAQGVACSTPASVGLWHGMANFNLSPTLRRKLRCPLVLTVHDLIPLLPASGLPLSFRLQFAVMLRRALAAADAVVTISPWTAALLAEHAPESRERVVVIPNGVPEAAVGRAWEQRLRMLYVARSEPYKRLPLFIEIAKIMIATRSDLQLDLVTDPRGRRLAYRLAPAALEAGRLTVHTALDEATLQQLFAETRVYLHPSLYEGFGLPPWQAYANGSAVVYTHGHALDTWMSGLANTVGLAPEASATDWAEAALGLAATQTVAPQLVQLPSWDDAAALLIALYRNLAPR